MKLIRKVGATSEIWQIFVADSSSTTGGGLTGLVFNTSSLTAYYHRDTDTTATAITLVTMTVGTFTSSGFKEIDATNMPGWYQFCPPNAALASGAKSCAFHLKGATNMAPLPIEVDLDAQVDVTHWNGTAVSSPATAGIPDVNVKNINNVAAATPGASGGILISGSNSGTTTLGALTVSGATTLAALSCTTLTASGAVAFQSTFATTGTTTFNAFTVTNNLLISGTTTHTGTTTFTGAVTASNASNNIVGIDVAKINAVATTSVTTVNANVGTTQPTNFTGTGASALVKSDMVDIAGAAVSTSTAQIGVNVVSFATGIGPLPPVRTGTCQSGSTSTTIKLDSGASATDHLYDDLGVYITGGTGAGQYRLGRKDYSGSGKTLTITPAWVTTPDNTSTFALLPNASVWDEVGADFATTGTTGHNVTTSLPEIAAGAAGGILRVGSNAGSVTLSGNFTMSSMTLSADLTVTGNTFFSGTTTYTGAITGTNASNNLRINGVAPGAAGGLFIAGTNAATTITTGLTTTFTGNLTGNVLGNVNGSVGSVASGGITSATFAAGAITAAAIADAAIDRATFAADTGMLTIRSNTATAGASTTITLDGSASATDNFYRNCKVYLTGGTGVGQERTILSYVGSTKVATVRAWATNPDNTTTFAILPDTSTWDDVTGDHLTSGSTGASLNAAGAAGDPWTTVLPGSYIAGQAGHIVGTALPDVAPGASGGLHKLGANVADVSYTGSAAAAVTYTGSANNPGINIVSGSSAAALQLAGGSSSSVINIVAGTNGTGIGILANGSGNAVRLQQSGGGTGAVLSFVNGGSGNDITSASPVVLGSVSVTGNVGIGGNFGVVGTTTFTGAVSATNSSNDVRLGSTENAAIVAAWGASVIGNGRTRDYFLQGGTNKIAFNVPGSGFYTIYNTDDSTALNTGSFTSAAGNPVDSLDPS